MRVVFSLEFGVWRVEFGEGVWSLEGEVADKKDGSEKMRNFFHIFQFKRLT